VDGEWRDVYKQPVTDSSKNSKRGILALVKNGDGYQTKRKEEAIEEDLLKLRYMNGELINETTFEEIRERANK
jgi:nicotinamide phosphoribosyltransferase